MRTSTRIKKILGGVCLAIMLTVPALSAGAQGTDEKVTVTTPGTLIDLVSDLESSRIHSLKIEGALNAEDLSYIGGGAGKITTVKELDLSDVTLIAGPAPYKTYKLKDNENGLLGGTTASFIISDTARIESRKVDIALGGVNTIETVYSNNLSGLFAGCGYEKVILPKNMKSLGYASFFGSEGIRDVEFPTTIQEIETEAFYSVSNLTQINLPASLKKLGYEAFAKSSLTEVALPASLDTICGRAFMATSLAGIDLKNVKSVGTECFSGCKLEGTLDVSNLDVISAGAFSRNAITGIKFGNKLTEIEQEAFYWNKKLTAVSLPEGLLTIGESAFEDCLVLESVEVPSSIQYIGYHAFDNTPWDRNLKGDNGIIYMGKIAYAYDKESAINPEVVEFREGTTEISANFSLGDVREKITKIVFPSTLKKIESGQYRSPFGKLEKLGDITLNEGLEFIGDYAFSGSKKLWFDKFPSTLKYIGNHAFENCDGLTEVTLHDGLKYIGNKAFSCCKGISEVRYRANPEYLGTDVFRETEGLYRLTIGKNVTWLGEYMFDVSGLQRLVFETPEERPNPISLGYYSLARTNLTNVELPSVDVLGEMAFYNCKQLESLTIDGDCNSVSQCTYGSTLKELNFKGTVKKIEAGAFNGCKQLQSLFIEKCDSIWHDAFYYSDVLENVTVSKEIGYIGEKAFAYCKALTEFPFEKVKSSGKGSFMESGLKNISLNENYTVIPAEMFYRCYDLETVTFAVPPVEVGDAAFYNCYNLKTFDFSHIKKIGGGAFNSVNFSDLDQLYLPDCFEEMGEGAFMSSSPKSVSLPGSFLSIPLMAFKDASRFNLEWRIPSGYTYEGNNYNVMDRAAFASALANTEVIVPEGVDEILNLVFYNNHLKTITLPSTLKLLFANALQTGEGGTVETIYCHAKTPPTVDTYGLLSTWVDDIFKGTIYVPASSVSLYKSDSFWGKYNIVSIPVEMESIILNAESLELEIGESYQLAAEVIPAECTDKDLVWASDNENVATVDQNGLVTITGEGETYIHVRSAVWSNVEASCRINAVMDVKGLISEVLPCDIYTFNGELLCKDVPATDVDKLRRGIYIIRQGTKRIKIIK